MLEAQIPQKPKSSSSAPKSVSFDEALIRTMPEKYIGAAAGRPPVVREIVETRTVMPPPPKPPATKPPPKKKNRRRLTIIVGAAVVLLAGIGSAAYIILSRPASQQPPPPVNVNKPPVNANKNVNTTPIPPTPVCGNGVLESGEECDDGNAAAGDGCDSICKAEPKTPPPPPNTGLDSDSDGLTDVEETAVYGTDPYNLDSDHDSFNDGNEVSHLYDPTLKAPALLKDSKIVVLVTNKNEGYSVLVPEKWSLSGTETPQLLAAAPTGEFFEILVTPKPAGQSLVEWYLAMSPGSGAEDVERFKTIEGYDALRSPDRLTAYVDPGNGQIYTLTYSFDDQTKLEFRTTYEAFVGGFELLKP